jgi:outer membrane protein assembly factor BamB
MRQSKIATLLFSLFLLLTLTNCNWLQFRYDANHSGQNPFDGLTPGTAAALTKITVFDTHGQDVFDSSAAVGVFGDPWPWRFTTIAFVQGNSGTFYAINISGSGVGTLRWISYLHVWQGFASAPAVDGALSIVYVRDNIGLNAFDVHTGTLLWYGLVSQAFGSPTVANGIVYLASDDGHIYGFDPSTCANSGGVCQPTFKSVTLNDGLSHDFFSSPAVANGLVYIADFAGSVGFEVLAFNLGGGNPGSVNWRTLQNGPISSTQFNFLTAPAVVNGVVYIGFGCGSCSPAYGGLRAYNASTGAPCWNILTLPKLRQIDSPAAVVTENGVPFAYVGAFDGLYKIDARCAGGGGVVPGWPKGGPIARSSAAVANTGSNEVIFVGSEDGKVYAYDSSGTSITNFPQIVGDGIYPVIFSPAVASQTVYVGCQDGGDGKLYAFR